MPVNDLRRDDKMKRTVGLLSKNKNVLDIIKNGNKIYAVTNEKLKKKSTDNLQFIPISEFFNPDSSQAEMIEGGYSLISNKNLSEILGLNSQIIFTYNLQNLSSLEKSKFSHELLGRGKKSNGLVGELGGKILGKGCITVPANNSDKISEIMKKWSVKFSTEKVMATQKPLLRNGGSFNG